MSTSTSIEPSTVPSTAALSNASASAADICARADELTAAGSPREALEVIAEFRQGLPSPTPTVTRRTLIPATPSPTPTPVVDCEAERLAAVNALGAELAPTETPVPTGAETFRSDWDRVVAGSISPFLPATLVALGGIAALLLLAVLLAFTIRGRGSATARSQRRLGLAAVVLAPIVFASTLPVGSAFLSLLLLALGAVGAALLARHDRRPTGLLLSVHDAFGGRDAAAAVDLVRRIESLVDAGYLGDAVSRVPLTPDLRPAPGALTRLAERVSGSESDRVRVFRGSAASAVVRSRPPGHDIGATVSFSPDDLRLGLRRAGIADDEVLTRRIEAEMEAAAVLIALDDDASARGPVDGRIRSIALQQLALDVVGATRDALLEAAAEADPTDIRVVTRVDSTHHRSTVEPMQLTGYLRRLQAAIDAGLTTSSDTEGDAQTSDRLEAHTDASTTVPLRGEHARSGWEPWLLDQLLTATAVALDLRALTGRPWDPRVELDARRLIRAAAAQTGSGAAAANQTVATREQMLAGVYFCELFPDERGSGSLVSRWADAASVDVTPDVAFAVACSYSAGWRDDMSPHVKVEIERHIAERLRWALPVDRFRERALVDPVLGRHAAHAWYLDLLDDYTPKPPTPIEVVTLAEAEPSIEADASEDGR